MKPFLISVSYLVLGLSIALGTSHAQAQQTAPEARPGATALPPVSVDTSRTKPRRVRAATPSRQPAANVAAQPQAKPADTQEARSGTIGYVAHATSTATKTNTALINIPQSVTVLTKEFIKDQNFQSLPEAIRYVPGVIPHQGEGNRDDFVIRGQRTNADLFVNGIRDDVQYFRDLYNTQSIEVLKGPNSMIFGRGGGGGIINRVLKEADGVPIREVTVQGGSYDNKRVSVDTGGAVNENVAGRINAVYEKSGSFRNGVELERYGINPTVTLRPNDATKVVLSYEYFHDNRTADRGIPSQNRIAPNVGPVIGRPNFPYPTDPSTYFGNPALSYSNVDAHIGTATIEHDFDNGVKIKNSSRVADYKKFYQNVYPGGAVNTAGTSVNLTAYNNQTDRTNVFNQTDLTYKFDTGWMRHTVLGGIEIGNQNGISQRNNGFFGPAFTSNTLAVNPVTGPTNFTAVQFRNDPTTVGGALPANNKYNLNLAAVYAQDQIEITRWLQVIGGLRFDRFDLDSTDRRTLVTINRVDNLVSPRAGLVLKPMENLAFYGSYSVSYLPSAGDQFSTLSPTLAITVPEKFVNTEVGAKWDVTPRTSITAAVYDLDRQNQRFTQADGTILAVGRTRTRGAEAAVSGYVTDQWQITTGYAYTDARITSDNSATIRQGNRVGLVPFNTLTMWNKFEFNPMWAAAVGVIYYDNFYASSSDLTQIPGFTRVDAALYFKLDKTWRAQLNIENVFDKRYYATADGDNNISPGAPRLFRASATANF